MGDSYKDSPALMWKPDRKKLTKMDEFRAHVNRVHGLKLGRLDYDKMEYLCYPILIWEIVDNISLVLF